MERARACLAMGAIAAALAASSVSAATVPLERPSTIGAAAVREPVLEPRVTADDEKHGQPDATPTAVPTMPPMDMGGHAPATVPPAESSPAADPHGHGVPAASASPTPGDDHGATPDDDHGATEAAGEKPREAVLGGFFAINTLVLAAAAITRRRDRAKAATRALTTPTPRKDASR